jgi:hypothetical protein
MSKTTAEKLQIKPGNAVWISEHGGDTLAAPGEEFDPG